MKRALLMGAALGLFAGAWEVALLTKARLGLSVVEVTTQLGIAVGLSAGLLMLLSALLTRLTRGEGYLFGSLLGAHAAMAWRFGPQLNTPSSQWTVLLPCALLVLLGLALGYALDPLMRRLKPAWIAAAAAPGVCWALLASPPSAAGTETDRPAIVLITLDTTRADHVTPLGSDNLTPSIARLAAEGATFEQAISTAPITGPSHLAMLTGLPPYASGIATNGVPIGEREDLLQKRLRAAGYATAAFVSGFPLHARFGWSQGFDVYDDDFGSLRGLHRLRWVRAWDEIALPTNVLRERRGEVSLRRALGWLDQHAGEDLFLWLHLFDPRAPYEAPGHAFDPPTDGSPLPLPAHWPAEWRAITSTDWLTEAYRAEIRYVDALVGELTDALENHNILDDTVVVVVADHGESLTEHGYYFHHGDHLYDPSLRVPLIVRYPERVPPGRRISCQASTAAIPATLLSLAGLTVDLPGGSLEDAMVGDDCSEASLVASTVGARDVANPPADHALRTAGWKYIQRGLGARECYNLTTDPGELEPVSDCPDLARELSATIDDRSVQTSPEPESVDWEVLRSLGYVD